MLERGVKLDDRALILALAHQEPGEHRANERSLRGRGQLEGVPIYGSGALDEPVGLEECGESEAVEGSGRDKAYPLGVIESKWEKPLDQVGEEVRAPLDRGAGRSPSSIAGSRWLTARTASER